MDSTCSDIELTLFVDFSLDTVAGHEYVVHSIIGPTIYPGHPGIGQVAVQEQLYDDTQHVIIDMKMVTADSSVTACLRLPCRFGHQDNVQ